MTTSAPATLKALAAFWVSKGGVNLGIVGDAAHRERAVSYHLGRLDLRDGAYSAVTARDRAGLSAAASAIDLGKLNGTFTGLRSFSGWLVDECRRNAPGTIDIREVIYTADGQTVLRYDRERGYASSPRPNEADASHLWHTHISYYRDSEFRAKTAVFARFWEPPDTSTEDDMGFEVTLPPEGLVSGTLRLKEGDKATHLHSGQVITVDQDATRRAFVVIRGSTRLRVAPLEGALAATSAGTFTPDTTPDIAAIVGAKLEQARDAAVDAVSDAIDGVPR